MDEFMEILMDCDVKNKGLTDFSRALVVAVFKRALPEKDVFLHMVECKCEDCWHKTIRTSVIERMETNLAALGIELDK